MCGGGRGGLGREELTFHLKLSDVFKKEATLALHLKERQQSVGWKGPFLADAAHVHAWRTVGLGKRQPFRVAAAWRAPSLG